MSEITVDELSELGLRAAANQLEQKQRLQEQRNKCAVAWAEAYARYPFVTKKQMDAFSARCQEEYDSNFNRKTLRIVSLDSYSRGVPPREVLDKLKEAKATGLFTNFQIAYIEWVKPVPDPILFGKINGCTDYFFVAQWLDDLKFEEIAAMPGE